MTDQPDNMTSLTKTRDGKGRYDRSPDTVERDAEAARLRAQSISFAKIGEALGISKQSAHAAVHRALAETLAEPAANLRQLEREKLDRLEQLVHAELERQHFVIANGKIMYIGEEPLHDTGAVLACVDRLVKISESRRKLDGTDSATKVDVSGGVTYQLVGVDVDKL
jgi:hypothetical protein